MDALLKKRATVKGKLTRAAKVSDEFLSSPAAVSAWSNKLDTIENQFETIQEQIESLMGEPENGEPNVNEIERDQFETTMLEVRSRAAELVSMLTPTNNESQLNHKSQPTKSQVKLPRINIPTFSGNWEEWPAFSQLFKKLVHDNEQYLPIEKFYYLKLYLAGEPASSITTLELTNENYEEAWSSLGRRYDNQRLIINRHLKTIFELPSVTQDIQLRAFVDQFTKALRALAAQGLPTDYWDAILVYQLSMKLGPGIRRQWEITIDDSTKMPELNELITFLEQRATAAEVIANSAPTKPAKPSSVTERSDKPMYSRTPKADKFSHLATDNQNQSKPVRCPICSGEHFAFQCKTYLQAAVTEREKLVVKHRLCGNCLNPRHAIATCRSSKCRKCNESHHTSLHKELTPNSPAFSGLAANKIMPACLPTACVLVTHQTRRSTVRMIIDSGSQYTFITESLARRLHLSRIRISSAYGSIEGVGGVSTTSTVFAAALTVTSRHSPYQLTVYARILPTITKYTPQLSNAIIAELHQQGLPLADDYNEDLPIDILLGAEYWAIIMQPSKRNPTTKLPPLLDSSFGWLVSGTINGTSSTSPNNGVCCFTIEDQLRRFWELEEAVVTTPLPHQRKMTPDELKCEQLYRETTTRDEAGRYIVMLPFNENQAKLGESRLTAQRQFYQIERRLQRDPEYRAKYHTFMREYEQLGHMTRVNDSSGPQYFLPHHAVTRPDDPSKFRVVFNGSQKTTTGVSLNDALYVGPPSQNDIFLLLIGFRRHPIGITCDAEKMYRQVMVHPSHRPYQQILYRYSPQEQLATFQLNTVTYGTSPASYLAMRTMKQLVHDEGANYPLAAPVFLNEDYVDDFLTGSASLADAHKLINELTQLASRGHFNLRKWCSNAPQALINVHDRATSKTYAFASEGNLSKVLGMLWETEADSFIFRANLPPVDGELTKRKLLSYLSRIFDPLGLIAPIVIVAKILLQTLWRQPVSWDANLNHEVKQAYETFRATTNQQLHHLQIPRHVSLSPTVNFSLHGFCDASEQAYACCIYVNATFHSGQSLSHLLCAKTRVAPISSVSLPRLELCGAVILARAMTKVAERYQCDVTKRFAYTDSTIVLAWLAKHPRTWKTFVSNRVSEIATLLPISQWRHVPSAHNSADIATRGATPDELRRSTLWWNPPLPPPPSSVQRCTTKSVDVIKEQRKAISLFTTTTPSVALDIVDKYSSHTKMLRVYAMVQYTVARFKARDNQLFKLIHQLPMTERLAMVPAPSIDQLRTAHNELVRAIQETTYPLTFKQLHENRPLKKRDPLRNQTPELDSKTSLLRVRGRLSKANLPLTTIKPIILPAKSNFTVALIRHLHETNLHAGPTLLISLIRQNYWISNVRDVVRRFTYKCVRCRRLNSGSPIQQPTGDLPQCRVTAPPRPFTHVGIDYGGPIQIRFSLARKTTSTKAYIALFVCMATKAIHLEAVSDLTTDAFLAALERFISRRGLPERIYSDNGTNFVSAQRKLTEIEEFLHRSKKDITRKLADQKIEFQFIPPYAPNFGGLWEAGIKSAKRLLVASAQGRLLTFEEIATILAQAEAVLNSRPLTPLASDEFEALTPGHFLIGAPLRASPVTIAADQQFTLSKRWRMVQEVSQAFWTAWRRDYLLELHQRTKSTTPTPVTIGELVLLRDQNSPPLTWPMARIESLHPGDDGIVRVVTVKTATAITKRAVSKLVRLLIDTTS